MCVRVSISSPTIRSMKMFRDHGISHVTFLTDENNPADDELLLELVLGLGSALRNPKEERNGYTSSYGIGQHLVRRSMKLLIARCNLPVPTARADEFIHWHQTGEKLSTITKLVEDKKCSKS